jgi:hypothetical protein
MWQEQVAGHESCDEKNQNGSYERTASTMARPACSEEVGRGCL